MKQNYVDFFGNLPRFIILSTSWEYMTNDTKITEAFLYDIFPKAAVRDGKAMVRHNSLWHILLIFLFLPTERIQYMNFYSISLA